MAQKNYTLTSPDGTLQATVATGSDLRILALGRRRNAARPVARLDDARRRRSAGQQPQSHQGQEKYGRRTDRLAVLQEGQRPRPLQRTRAYDARRLRAGSPPLRRRLAYRFTTRKKDGILVENEQVAYTFPGDYTAYAPYVGHKRLLDFEGQFRNSFENTYTRLPLTQLDPRKLIFLPVLVELPGGRKMVITEADLQGYPGLFLNNSTEAPVLKGVFAPYPKKEEQGGHNQLQMLVTEREPYIAATEGTRSFPWRVMAVSKDDSQLLDNDLVYRLAPASKIADTSWIKPGKVAWEWWNASNLYDVDFKAGINNETYKYYIWFASQHGIEYVILDEGWAVNKQADLMQVVPEIDLEELVEYGRERNVGIILWAGYYAFERDMERVVKHYADMGVKGFKVDFMDRDDQRMVDFLHRAAEVCAEHKMLARFPRRIQAHGAQPHMAQRTQLRGRVRPRTAENGRPNRPTW